MLKRHFPELLPGFIRLPDNRKAKGKQYRMEELMMGGLSTFILKSGSRNQLNNDRKSGYFSKHYHNLFGLKLPHLDTVNKELRRLDPAGLDQIKMDLMSNLLAQKFLRKARLLDQYYLVAVDATGVMSFDKRHCAHCLTKKSKNGTMTYFHYVLEAKLVTKDGLAISLVSEWINNPSGEFNKQDCERKAFLRLSEKLKKQYPHLPVCILADGLYPYENAFKACEDNRWKFIFVLKEGSLSSVQEELTLTRRSKPIKTTYTVKDGWRITGAYRYHTDIQYHKKYTLNWVQCQETLRKTIVAKNKETCVDTKEHCFEYLTNLTPGKENVRAIASAGRLRWKIENEGFNTQKNNDYELEHKFCEKSYPGLQNYYTLLQIAHAINQLIEREKCITDVLKSRPKETITNLWKNLKGYFIFCIPVMMKYCASIAGNLMPAPS